MKKKNKHAVELGRLGGAAGKGSPARKRAARRAAEIRWAKELDPAMAQRAYDAGFNGGYRGASLKCIAEQFGFKNWRQVLDTLEHYKNIMKKDLTIA